MIKPTPYSFLHSMCCSQEGRDTSNSWTGFKEMTNRAKLLCKILELHGISYSIDRFEDRRHQAEDGSKLYYFNIEVFFESKEKTEDTLMFIAHHDVNNINSENCQDNTASVINLVDLCDRIKDKDLDKNVSVVFTDCEEFGGLGSIRLSERIVEGDYGNVLAVVNSELTALGDSIWLESKGFLGEYLEEKLQENYDMTLDDIPLTEKATPFNDSWNIRRFPIESVCFGLLPNDELEEMYPVTWRLCHSADDVFDGSSQEDMKKYVDFLESLI